MKKQNGIKVVFVEPRGANANVFDRYMTIPMLGPLYLGTMADEAGYDVSILNENLLGRQVSGEELAEADILCMSSMTATINRGKAISRQYKSIRSGLNRESWSIVGGIHASMIPEDVADDFDQVFIGEAETKILDVLSGKIREKFVRGNPAKNLDDVPVVNFNLLKNFEKMWALPVMTSRGCPYNCTFCSVTEMFGRGYRVKSVQKVLEEVASYQHNRIFFVDDHFVVRKNRTKELIQGFRDRKLKFRWSCQVRTELSRDVNMVRDMRSAGCRTVYIGFESINPESLEEMNKNQSVEDIKRSVQVFRKYGINIHGMFMFGADSDKSGIFRETFEFCKNSGISTVQYMIMTPLPGTVLFRQLEKQGRLLHRNWEYYDAMHVVFMPKNLSPAELQKGMIEAYSSFYSYTNAFNDALNLFFETMQALFIRISRKVYLPSIIPTAMKVFGKKIVRAWISHNKPYMSYLDRIEGDHE